jgi:hypothetical protein
MLMAGGFRGCSCHYGIWEGKERGAENAIELSGEVGKTRRHALGLQQMLQERRHQRAN